MMCNPCSYYCDIVDGLCIDFIIIFNCIVYTINNIDWFAIKENKIYNVTKKRWRRPYGRLYQYGDEDEKYIWVIDYMKGCDIIC